MLEPEAAFLLLFLFWLFLEADEEAFEDLFEDLFELLDASLFAFIQLLFWL